MKKFVSVLGVLFLVGLLTACVTDSTGVKIEPETLAKIKKGETTKEHVVSLLGEPNSTVEHDNKEIFMYSYSRQETSGKMFIPFAGPFVAEESSEYQSVMISFDEKGIVESVSKQQGKQRGW